VQQGCLQSGTPYVCLFLSECIPASMSFPENFGSVLRDCSKVLSANTKCSKAYYRSALALLKLERTDEALDCCDRCLSYDPENSSMKAVKERTLKAKEEAERKEREKQERIRKEEEKKLKMKMALRVRIISSLSFYSGSARYSYNSIS